jgi:hypothetical protein
MFLKPLFYPTYPLLMSASIIYNHVSTGRGEFYRLEAVGLGLIEEHTYHTPFRRSERVCYCVGRK